jgi:hypothetical protein
MWMHKIKRHFNQAPNGRAFTAADVRLMLSSPVYAYGTCGLQPAEHVAEEVMKLNAKLSLVVRETGASRRRRSALQTIIQNPAVSDVI